MRRSIDQPNLETDHHRQQGGPATAHYTTTRPSSVSQKTRPLQMPEKPCPSFSTSCFPFYTRNLPTGSLAVDPAWAAQERRESQRLIQQAPGTKPWLCCISAAGDSCWLAAGIIRHGLGPSRSNEACRMGNGLIAQCPQ